MSDARRYQRTYPVATASEMQAFEKHCFASPAVSERVVLESAGRSVAEAVGRFAPEGSILVVIGSGNNGGDGLVAARTLLAAGRDVSLVSVGSGFNRDLLHGWEIDMTDLADDTFAETAVIIDAMLGTGATGAPRDAYAKAIHRINRSSAFVVAIDGPTGVDLSDGSVPGAAVQADLTVTFGVIKWGHLLFPGRKQTGRLLLAEVGFPPLPVGSTSARLVSDGWAGQNLPSIEPDAHKGEMGILGIVAGRSGMAGAALMSAMGALRSGAGGIRIFSEPANRWIVQTAIPEAIFHPRTPAELDVHLSRLDAVVVGPGMGTDEDSRAVLETILGSRIPAVVDADALTLLAEEGDSDRDLSECILTPHPGELARLAQVGTAEVLADRTRFARQIAERWGTTVLAKGAPSIVVGGNGPVLVSAAGHSGIATGGMGDTLSGVCGAMLAMGVEPQVAAAIGLHFSGRAAELAGRGRGLLPRDVAEALPAAMSEADTELSPSPFLMDLPPAR